MSIYNLKNITNIKLISESIGVSIYRAYDKSNECDINIRVYDNGKTILDYGNENEITL